MKKLTLLLAAVICALTATAQEPQFNDNKVISHRGAWKNTGHPQNSLASFRAAAERGCHGSECDVHLTLDDSLVVYHDLSHAGMLIEKTKYADLVKVPLKNSEKIPTLHEYIIRAKQYPQTKLIIDVKTPKEAARATRIALAAAKVVKAMNFEKSVEYLVGYLPAVDELRAITDCPVAYLGRWKYELPEMHPDTILRRKIKFLDYQGLHYIAHPEWVEVFQRNGIHLNAWIIDSEEEMDWFLKHNFDYITTDNPERLLEKTTKKK